MIFHWRTKTFKNKINYRIYHIGYKESRIGSELFLSVVVVKKEILRVKKIRYPRYIFFCKRAKRFKNRISYWMSLIGYGEYRTGSELFLRREVI